MLSKVQPTWWNHSFCLNYRIEISAGPIGMKCGMTWGGWGMVFK